MRVRIPESPADELKLCSGLSIFQIGSETMLWHLPQGILPLYTPLGVIVEYDRVTPVPHCSSSILRTTFANCCRDHRAVLVNGYSITV